MASSKSRRAAAQCCPTPRGGVIAALDIGVLGQRVTPRGTEDNRFEFGLRQRGVYGIGDSARDLPMQRNDLSPGTTVRLRPEMTFRRNRHRAARSAERVRPRIRLIPRSARPPRVPIAMSGNVREVPFRWSTD